MLFEISHHQVNANLTNQLQDAHAENVKVGEGMGYQEVKGWE
jgi:hypothetical protein